MKGTSKATPGFAAPLRLEIAFASSLFLSYIIWLQVKPACKAAPRSSKVLRLDRLLTYILHMA